MLYHNLPESDRFAAAANDGFKRVEILAPYNHPPQWYAEQLKKHSLQLVLINVPAPGFAATPLHEPQFKAGIIQAAQVCRLTGCKAVHILAGDKTTDSAQQSQTLRQNISWAIQQYPLLTWHLEALNAIDMPNYFYSEPQHVIDEIISIDNANVGMQFDFYHVIKQGLNLEQQISLCASFIRHVQVAGSPERNEPDACLDTIVQGFHALKDIGYNGVVGLEYRPKSNVAFGLSWLNTLIKDGLLKF